MTDKESPGAQLGRLAEERAAAKGIKLSQAFDEIKRERPELVLKYLHSVGAGGRLHRARPHPPKSASDLRATLAELAHSRAARDGIGFVQALWRVIVEHQGLGERVVEMYEAPG